MGRFTARLAAGLAAILLALSSAAPAQADRTGRPLFERGVEAAKARELAEAAHLFRRVLLRQPQHADARHNLQLATQALGVEAGDDLDAGGLRGVIEGLAPTLCLALIAALQGAGLLGLAFGRRRRALWLAPIALGMGLAGMRAHYQWQAEPAWATVMAPRAPLQADEAGGAEILTLRAGEAVRVEWWKGGWVLVRHGDDRGWTERTALAAIR